MSAKRPYIPLSVRVQVAERQVSNMGPVFWPLYVSSLISAKLIGQSPGLGVRLKMLLTALEPDRKVHLDHDPALILRKWNKRTEKYSPDANDPDFLIYRTYDDHQQKTTGRKPGALRTVTTKGSDIGIKTKFARLANKRAKPRGFGGGRKIASRPFQRRSKNARV